MLEDPGPRRRRRVALAAADSGSSFLHVLARLAIKSEALLGYFVLSLVG